MEMDIADIIRAGGGASKLARALKRHHTSILGWKKVPAELVPEVSRITNIPRHLLRPGLWDAPEAAEAEPMQATG